MWIALPDHMADVMPGQRLGDGVKKAAIGLARGKGIVGPIFQPVAGRDGQRLLVQNQRAPSVQPLMHQPRIEGRAGHKKIALFRRLSQQFHLRLFGGIGRADEEAFLRMLERLTHRLTHK